MFNIEYFKTITIFVIGVFITCIFYFEEILLQIENSLNTRNMARAVKLYWKFKIKIKELK